MPPSQWLKLRQYIIPGESASTSPKIEEPVVVNPDTISNRASTKFGISLEKTNGRHPKKLNCNPASGYADHPFPRKKTTGGISAKIIH